MRRTMRIIFALALIAAGLMISTPAKAQSWQEELARLLVDAGQFATYNGVEGPSERILQFEDVESGEQIERVLEACGH